MPLNLMGSCPIDLLEHRNGLSTGVLGCSSKFLGRLPNGLALECTARIYPLWDKIEVGL
jgi:hypothetical protein